MTFPWNLINRWVCMHCYRKGRHTDRWRTTRRQALRNARSCARKAGARRSRMVAR